MTAIIICGTAAAAHAHTDNSAPHEAPVAHGSPAAGGQARTWADATRENLIAVAGGLAVTASAPRGAKAGSRMTLKRAASARALQEEIDLD
jgi:hypothetical protein